MTGDAIFSIGGVFGGDRALNSDQLNEINNPNITAAQRNTARANAYGSSGSKLQDNPVFSDRVRLIFDSSFFGKDRFTTTDSNLLKNNRRFHKLLTDGIEVEYLLNEQIVHDKVWLIDSDNLLNNDWLVIHPFTVVEGSHAHCPDVVFFINGLPLAVIVSVQSTEKATLKTGFERIWTYIKQIPKLFSCNTLLVISCGNRARVGTLTSDWQEFLPWHTIDGEDFPAKGATELEVLIQGIFDKRRIREFIQHFIVFEDT